jgi:hypothetical protein
VKQNSDRESVRAETNENVKSKRQLKKRAVTEAMTVNTVDVGIKNQE